MKIRATVEVAILFIANDSCQFVQFVGKKNNSRHFRCARKRQFQVVPVVVIKQPLIALVPIRATDPVAIQSIEMIRVNPCNSWAKNLKSVGN